VMGQWRQHYKTVRPRAALGYRASGAGCLYPCLEPSFTTPSFDVNSSTRTGTKLGPDQSRELDFLACLQSGAQECAAVPTKRKGPFWNCDVSLRATRRIIAPLTGESDCRAAVFFAKE